MTLYLFPLINIPLIKGTEWSRPFLDYNYLLIKKKSFVQEETIQM